MRARRSSTSLTILSLLVVAAVLAVAGSASSADHQAAWSWQSRPMSAPTTLAASQLGSDRVTLTAVTDQSGEVTLVVRSDGTQIQEISADSTTDAPLVPFLVTGVSGGASLVGVARGDVAHVMLFTGSNARELPLNSANAFAAEGIDGAPPLRLQALAADGAPIGAIVIPPSGAICGGGSIGACSNSSRLVTGGTVPRAFLRPRRSSDALPSRGLGSNTVPIGTSQERILDTRRIAGRKMRSVALASHWSSAGGTPTTIDG
jgi:hypothetical protein